MAFNMLEYLEIGNIDFVFNLTPYDYKSLIRYVRESNRRVKIVNGFLSKLKDIKPRFCFEIIYDMDEFIEDAKYLLEKYYSVEKLSQEQIESLLFNSSLGYIYLEEHFVELIEQYRKDLTFIFKHLFTNMDKFMPFLRLLAYHSDLHIRFLFLKYLCLNHPTKINLFYDDIVKYVIGYTYQSNEQLSCFPDTMNMKDICELAFIFLDNDIDYQTWLKLKQFILDNYSSNELAFRLLNPKKQQIELNGYHYVANVKGEEEFNKDADTLFSTSSNYRLNILNRYSQKVSKELIDTYRRQLSYFYKDGKIDNTYQLLEAYGLGRNVFEYVDKYLSISEDTTYSWLETGSTAACYRIGDYVIKLVRMKWSHEKIICPDLYLILPNLEEIFIRDDDGVVLSGIEVQKYLKRSAQGLPLRLFTNFKNELNSLGYYTTDTLINGSCGDNCRMLDNYLDSGNDNPPSWFKEYPIVLIDRDRIYSLENRNPQQLRAWH